jgi:hypothetical protein
MQQPMMKFKSIIHWMHHSALKIRPTPASVTTTLCLGTGGSTSHSGCTTCSMQQPMMIFIRLSLGLLMVYHSPFIRRTYS